MPCGPDGGGGSGGPGDPIPLETRKDLARFRALNLLSSRPECFKALSPDGNREPGQLNPITVLSRVPIKIEGPNKTFPTAYASVAPEDVGRGTAALKIIIHPPFADITYDPLDFDFLAFTLTREVTFEDLQVLTILHEIAHLTGVLPGESTLGPLPADFPPGSTNVGQVFDTKLLVHCIGAAQYG